MVRIDGEWVEAQGTIKPVPATQERSYNLFIYSLLRLDRLAAAWVVAHRLDLLNGTMWMVSRLGRNGLIWYVIAGVLALSKRLRWPDAVRVALALLLAAFVADVVLKPLVGRERPFLAPADVQVIGERPSRSSFPSGHAANAFAAAFALSHVAGRARVVWWALAMLIAYSRVYLGVHYPLDVVGGALVGVLCAAVALRVTRRYT